MDKRPHISILENEMAGYFSPSRLNVYVDATVGAGGHAKRILEEHPEITAFFCFDQDPEALAIAKNTLMPWSEKVTFIRSNFEKLGGELRSRGIHSIDGCFFDLGVSSMQLDNDYRGFSFLKDGPLDMRMDPTNPINAAKVIAESSEEELGRIFREYGEEPRWKAAAKAVVEERKKQPILTTKQLSDLLVRTLKTKLRGKLHPATLPFQALRIFVNRETEILENTLRDVISLLSPGGVVGVISFHSFEDRIVKNVFRDEARPPRQGKEKPIPVLSLLTKKPIVPSPEEIRTNIRARSAKLRFARKIKGLL